MFTALIAQIAASIRGDKMNWTLVVLLVVEIISSIVKAYYAINP